MGSHTQGGSLSQELSSHTHPGCLLGVSKCSQPDSEARPGLLLDWDVRGLAETLPKDNAVVSISPLPCPSQALGINRDVIDKYLVCAGPSQTPLGQVLLAVGE